MFRTHCPGVRATLGGTIDNARLEMRPDVGLGGKITPAPRGLDLPSLLLAHG